jgi:hypothetical protein
VDRSGRVKELYVDDESGIDSAILQRLGVDRPPPRQETTDTLTVPVQQVVESVGNTFGWRATKSGEDKPLEYDRGRGPIVLLALGQLREFWLQHPEGVTVKPPSKHWLESPDRWIRYNRKRSRRSKRPEPAPTDFDLRQYWTMPDGKKHRVYHEDFLHYLGHWYMELLEVTDAPAPFIADSCNARGNRTDPVTLADVHGWIRKARAAGFIPKLEPGSRRSLRFDQASWELWQATHGRL